jgi:hypothetical protein
MRKALKEIEGKRSRFRATVLDFGEKRNWRGFTEATILLGNVIMLCSGELMTDHIWFACGASWDGCKVGDFVEFDARVKVYWKGYVNHRKGIDERTKDYRLSHPSKVEVV